MLLLRTKAIGGSNGSITMRKFGKRLHLLTPAVQG